MELLKLLMNRMLICLGIKLIIKIQIKGVKRHDFTTLGRILLMPMNVGDFVNTCI